MKIKQKKTPKPINMLICCLINNFDRIFFSSLSMLAEETFRVAAHSKGLKFFIFCKKEKENLISHVIKKSQKTTKKPDKKNTITIFQLLLIKISSIIYLPTTIRLEKDKIISVFCYKHKIIYILSKTNTYTLAYRNKYKSQC